MNETPQATFWRTEFGNSFTDRNDFNTVESVDLDYKNRSGVTRREMNREFLSGLPKDARILEIGANMGGQLAALQADGFTNLYGVDVNDYAIEKAKKTFDGLNVIKAYASDLPFKDGFFDLAFTSVVLIHIHPDQLEPVMREIHRVTRRYIWGYEYYSPTLQEINYRGNTNVCWKMDFKQRYLDLFPDLKVVKQKDYQYLHENACDQMFLLEK
jgi:pseudaminic acid biosynthesis-associated methylase